jgi:Ca2+-transporting ATPase
MKSKEILTIKNEKIKSLSKNQFIKKNEIDIHNGLSSNEAKLRNNKYGLNVINKKDNNLFLLKIILNQFKDLMNVMIIGIIIFNVVSITYLPSDSIIDFATQTSVLSIILFLNIFLSIFYEIRAKRALDSIEKNIPILAKVLRDGKIVNINVSEITIGDIVYLDEGTIVPADLMLIESNSLKIEEAALTGEAIPSEKDSEKEINENVALGDKINCAFSSTVVTYGSGIGIVTAIGKDTEIGKIANLISASSESKKISLLKKKVNTLITNLTIISFTSLILCIVLNTILFLTQYSSSGGDYHF